MVRPRRVEVELGTDNSDKDGFGVCLTKMGLVL